MKLALMFLPIFAAVSHQQYQPFMMGFPWMSRYIQNQPFVNEYFMPNRYQRYNDDSAVGHYNPAPPIIFMANDADFEASPLQMGPQYLNQLNNDNGFNDIQGRIKGFGSRKPLFGKQQNGRFFFNNNFAGGSTGGNPLIKTATLTITSTCTALTVQSCIPALNILAPPVACARKRQIRQRMLDEDSHQYPITPTEVRIVMPTIEPNTAERVPRQHRFGISSSMNEDTDNEQTGLRGTENQIRNARFFYLYQNFVTGLTTTSWFVTSIISTKTYIPTDAAAAIITLSCIPPGYITC